MILDKKTFQNDPPKEKIKFILDLFNSNKLSEATKEIKKQLTIYPKSPVLFNILGAVFAGQNRLEDALTNYNESIKINPKYFQAYINLGVCMHKAGEIKEAIINYQKAIEIEPNNANAHNNLGAAFKEQGESKKSIECYKKAIEVDPKHADAHNNLGAMFNDLKEYKKSIHHYEKSIEINPKSAIAYSNLGNVYKRLSEFKKAISCYEKSIEINPKYPDSYNNLGTLLGGELVESEKAVKNYLKAIEIQPDHPFANSNLLFHECWLNNNEYLKISEKYYKKIRRYDEKGLVNLKKSAHKSLKVGFISGDFRNHSVIFFLLDTFKYLKKKEIKLFGYHNNSYEDNFTKLIKQYFDNWSSVFYKPDKDLINLIRKDNLDILFDLSGHTANNRLAIFKNRCAPVQAAWCGWLATTGIKEIDYIIGDKHATPKSDQSRFTEKIYQLKKIWECSSPESYPKVPFIKQDNEKHIIFGYFGNITRVNETVINVWSNILNQIPNSKLFLKCRWFDIPEAKKKIIEKFNNKINKNQLITEGNSLRDKYLESYNKVDIMLDAFPISGSTISFDSSYMGVPILTKINDNSFWFRTGESINKNLNMDDWIAKDENDYVQKAIKFSENKNSLINLKTELRNLAMKSSLFDPKNYSNDFYEMLLDIR